MSETDINLPEYFFHYCSLDSFTKIILSGSLFRSHTIGMNDFTDSKFLFEILKKKVKEKISEIGNEKIFKEFLEYIDLNIIDCFITSFSAQPDVLSQWTMYADNGRGVAIGFWRNSFENIMAQIPQNARDAKYRIGIFPIEYIDEEGTNVFIDYILKSLMEGKEYFDLGILFIRYMMNKKHFSFKNEEEIRIAELHDLRSGRNINPAGGLMTRYVGESLEYRIKNNNQIIPYFSRKFLKEDKSLNNGINEEFHLHSIWLGPESEVNHRAIELFLDKRRIKVDKGIHYSKSPFRN